MKDFDEERLQREQRDRRVKIGGRELTFKPAIRPETFARYVDLVAQRMDPAPTEAEAIILVDETVVALLEPDSRAAWREVRDADTDHPITSADMHGLIAHITSVQNARPTEPASPSTNGAAQTSTGSTDDSSLPEVVAQTT